VQTSSVLGKRNNSRTERDAVVLAQAVARTEALAASSAVVLTTVDAVGDVLEKRFCRHISRIFPRVAFFTPKPLETVLLHEMLDQQRLVGANGVVTQGTVTIVVTVGVQVNTAVAKVVVKLRHSARLEVAVTVTTYGERVHILGVRNQTFLAHQRRAARTFGLHLVRSHVTEEDRVIATKLFRTILALGEIVVLTAVLFQVRARDNFVACQTFVEWFFGVRSHVSKKVCPIGIDGLATDLALWKSVRFTAVGFQEIPTRNNFVARHTFCGWFVVVRGQMTIEVDVVGIDGLATATNGEIVTLNCMFELFATDNLRVACCESTLFNRVGLIDMFFKHP
jgi:hypothetical protein